jgi:hypothetical protein
LRYEAHPSSALESDEKLHVSALTAEAGFKYVYKFFGASLWPSSERLGSGSTTPSARSASHGAAAGRI